MNTYNTDIIACEESIGDSALGMRAREESIGASAFFGNDALRRISSFDAVPSVMTIDAFNQHTFSCSQHNVPLLSSVQQTNALPESTPIEIMLNLPLSCKQPCLPEINQPAIRPISSECALELPPRASQEPKQAPRRVSNWQEISNEINRFAEENMKSSGTNFWLSKKKNLKLLRKEELDENTMSFLSGESIESIHKREMVFRISFQSTQALQAWDKKMGLKKSHSRMMTRSSVTRRKMLHALRELKRRKERCDRN